MSALRSRSYDRVVALGTATATRALLEGLFDDAGLFPPASLPMPDALARHRADRAGPDAWLLGRFVCPASRLGELAGEPLVLTVVVDAPVETSWPVVSLERRVRSLEEIEPNAAVPVYYESPVELLPGIQAAGARAKLRCGGVTADAFPDPEHVSEFIAACRHAGIPFKATAGLHHPVRGVEPATGLRMHGFLNLLAASVLDLSDDELLAAVEDEDPASFELGAERFAWRDHAADADAIARARGERFVSIGSCSFAEPVEDLRALGAV